MNRALNSPRGGLPDIAAAVPPTEDRPLSRLRHRFEIASQFEVTAELTANF
jgi:hypothetical protein